MEEAGLGVKINFADINEENIYNALNEVLHNPKYKRNIQRVSKLFKSQPQRPLDRAIWWIKWVVENPESAKLLAVEYNGFLVDFSLDIIFFLVACSMLIIYLTTKIRKIFRGSDKIAVVKLTKKEN